MKLHNRDIIKNFGLEILSGDETGLKKTVDVYGINRAGLELSGYKEEDQNKFHRIILMSNKEYNFIKSFSEQERLEKYRSLVSLATPMIIITKKFLDPLLIEAAKEKNFLLVKTNADSTIEFTRFLLDFMDNYFAPQIEMHGSMVSVYGKGVFIKGKSGIGKSEITIELMKKNHLFIGDDRIVMIRKNDSIVASAHEILKNLIEVRGVGIMDISRSSGYQVIMDKSQLDLIVELSDFDGINDNYERIGNTYMTQNILGLDIPYINIPVSSGRNLANIVETAVAQFKVRLANPGTDVAKILEQRVAKYKEEQEAND